MRNNFLVILCFLPLIAVMAYKGYDRHMKLRDYERVTVRVYKINTDRVIGAKHDKNYAWYAYIYQGITYTKVSQFYGNDVKEGDVFEGKISIKDPTIIEVDFSKKVGPRS